MGVIMPDEVIVVGQQIVVSVVPSIDFEQEGKRIEAYGVYDGDGPVILLSEGQGPSRLRHTFVHENLHAMLDLANASARLGTKREERTVTSLAPVLLSWLRSNPDAVRWLQESE